MKTQRAVLPLAFLSAAFMLGCQDQGSEPVGPEGLAPLFDPGGAGKGGPNKKGGSVLADLTLGLPDPVTGEPATGLVNLTPQEVSFKDGEGTIQFARQKNDRKNIAGIELRFDLANTDNAGIVAGVENYCVLGGQGASNASVDDLKALFDELVQEPLQELNSFWVSIDKTALVAQGNGSFEGESDEHGLNVAWLEELDGTARQLTLGANGAGPATVTKSGEFGKAGDPLTFKFTGGFIRLKNHSGTVKERFSLLCENLDTITMILTSQ